MNVLLLNPPGEENFLRDYYCSKISKANYILHPVDLYMLSGFLNSQHRLHVLDAIVERLPKDACLQRILDLDVDAIIFLTGQVSYKSDFRFIERIKDTRPQIKIIATGDIFMQEGEKTLKKFDFIDAALLDFTTDDILKFLNGQNADNMVTRHRKTVRREQWGQFEIPLPRHDLFKNELYSSPFMKQPGLVTVLTDYGCPHKCDFCIMSTLGYKFRSIENVLEELKFVRSLGIREIYFDDQSFGINKARNVELLAEMTPMGFFWSCLTRVDLMTDDCARAMKAAGCHTVILGVESGSQKILDRYHKSTTKEKIKEGFKNCRRYGIRTAGTFIIGLPGETEGDVIETIRFAKELKCDYASFNTPVARMSTPLREEALSNKWIDDELYEMDQSGHYGIFGTQELPADRIQILRDKAIRKFYFRFSYILQRLKGMTTFYEFMSNIRNGLVIWNKL